MGFVIDEENYLEHYGVLRRSGRYPWGSGGPEFASNSGFLKYEAELRKAGFSEADRAKAMGMSTTQMRAAKSNAKSEQKAADIAMVQRLKDKGLSNPAIAERMGLAGESSVRALLAPGAADKGDALKATTDMLRAEVDAKTYLDVGTGVENYVGLSKERMNNALARLKEEGYEVHTVKVSQLGTDHDTTFKVLTPPGVTQKEAWQNRLDIKPIEKASLDNGRTYIKDYPPLSIDPKRVDVKFAEDGGNKADGVIYVRPGVEDISLGTNRYAQVRVKVGEDRYLKGMAIYKDDLPPGVDLQFNTNKRRDSPDIQGDKLKAMKTVGDDPLMPFGTVTRSLLRNPGTDKEEPYSVMNIVNEEGKWADWGKNLASQMLSKQSPVTVRQQLAMTQERRQNEFNEIMGLTNPIVRQRLLREFAAGTDSAAVNLKAAALPRQSWQVILPINSLKETEAYAPGYNDGETLALIRYPHGGKFEIPIVTVNNKNREARGLIGTDTRTAIGINHKTAERLSGADFDGDAVIAIPNGAGKIKSDPALERLKGFDPQSAYPSYPGMKKVKPKTMQTEMGNVSNLITDMSLGKASPDELARAVRHSMVVIDSEKHNLNYRQSALDNGIKSLKEKYQGINPDTGRVRGASTLISRAESEIHVPQRKLRPAKDGGSIDRDTGKVVYVDTGYTRVAKDGSIVPKTEKVARLALTDDAYTLVSANATPVERLYADHSNKLKSLANRARLEMINTPNIKMSPSAKKAYAPQVNTLRAKLDRAQKNAPLERQAQLLAAANVKAKKAATPDLEGDRLRKVQYRELLNARARMGAEKSAKLIDITPEEWSAVQAGAISSSMLRDILDNADMAKVRELATPRANVAMTSAKSQRAKAMLASGYTRAEVAAQLGVSMTTLDVAMSEGGDS